MSVYPCCECCLTDTPHPYGHETSCKKCNNPTADRLRAEVEQLTAQIEAVRSLAGEYAAVEEMFFGGGISTRILAILDGVA